MATDMDKEQLAEIKRKMIALRNAIEDYVDGIDIDEAEGKKAGKAKKTEEDDG